MAPIHYHGRRFRPVSNGPNGQVSGETEFVYYQTGGLLTGIYAGGGIRHGQIVGRVNADGSLEFLYQHLSDEGELRSGHCESKPEILPDGRIRLHETWRWTSGDPTSGESVLEEVRVTWIQ